MERGVGVSGVIWSCSAPPVPFLVVSLQAISLSFINSLFNLSTKKKKKKLKKCPSCFKTGHTFLTTGKRFCSEVFTMVEMSKESPLVGRKIYSDNNLLCQLPEERKLDLLKNLAESSPYSAPQDSRQILPSTVQLLKVQL